MLWIKSLPTRCCAFVSVLAMLFSCTPEENNTSGTDEPGGALDKTIHVTGISLNPTAITIKEGESATITATVTPDNADNKAYSWSSSNDQVASVSDGKVIGIKAGSATIIVATEDGGKTATCSVTVEQNLAPSVTVGADHISAISALLQGKANLGNSASSDLKVGFQYSKSAGILPSNSTTIEATDADANYNYTASITALEPDTKYYFRSFVRQNGQDTYGETKEFTTKEISSILETLDATGVEATSAILNAKLDLTDVKYESIKHGFYWGTSEGSQNTFINGEAKDNAMTASMTGLNHKTQYWYKSYVKLGTQTFYGEVKTFTTDVVKVESISLDKTDYTFNSIGNTVTLKATIFPADATDKSVEWSSDNESVATVDNNGRVTAKDNGKAVITVKTKDQEMTATCAVTVSVPVSSISLNKTTLTLNEGEEETLVPTINPSSAADKTIKWTSSDTSVATVDAGGKVTAVSKGTATIKAEANDGSGKYATCSVNVLYRVEPLVAVDLGLSIKWANENIGARRPEDYGDYYAWGEIETKENYSWSTYKWGTSSTNLTKYNTDSSCGSVDNKTVLDPEDDAAHVILGGKWRMPTDAEWTELREKCTWTWTTQNGVNGRLVTGPNGNSIFLPTAGGRGTTYLYPAGSRGYYWSSSLNTDYPSDARGVTFYSDRVYRNYGSRCNGFSIRPVSE